MVDTCFEQQAPLSTPFALKHNAKLAPSWDCPLLQQAALSSKVQAVVDTQHALGSRVATLEATSGAQAAAPMSAQVAAVLGSAGEVPPAAHQYPPYLQRTEMCTPITLALHSEPSASHFIL